MAKVVVFGAGYVGLVQAAGLAAIGHDVVLIDVDSKKLALLQEGKVPFYEPGLEELLEDVRLQKTLRFHDSSAAPCTVDIAGAELIFVAVGTPPMPDGSADTSQIMAVVGQVAEILACTTTPPWHQAVVIKSTVPPGTAARVRERLPRTVAVLSNPEFLREGQAVYDFFHPDRVVIGCSDSDIVPARALAALYGASHPPRSIQKSTVLITSNCSAELIKYASNTMLAMRISFANEVAQVCEALDADVRDVTRGMGLDRRIGPAFLEAGIGWGGSCFIGKETVLVKYDGAWRLLRFAELFDLVAGAGAAASQDHVAPSKELLTLSWNSSTGRVEPKAVTAVTRRRYEGTLIKVRTKMGRRITVTEDHPFFVADAAGATVGVKLARELTTTDWLPVASTRSAGGEQRVFRLVEELPAIGLKEERIKVWKDFTADERAAITAGFPASRRGGILSSNVLRLDEARAVGVSLAGSRVGTVHTGKLPYEIPATDEFWWVAGMYAAEGWCSTDRSGKGGAERVRLSWALHPTDEDALVERIADYWRSLNVKINVWDTPTSKLVSVSSKLLGLWWRDVFGAGKDSYDVRVPDALWDASDSAKLAFLSGYWQGDGHAAVVANGRGVVLNAATASPALADGLLRLFSDLGVTASVAVRRVLKSTVDTYWIGVSGAAQVRRMMALVKPWKRAAMEACIGKATKQIKPTGFRELGAGAMVRVVETKKQFATVQVYSMEVEGNESIVVTGGLVAHNCFGKDVSAFADVASKAGVVAHLAGSTILVNRAQRVSVVRKVLAHFHPRLPKKVAVWGVAFKPETDDIRDSPALDVIGALIDHGCEVSAYDPKVPTSVLVTHVEQRQEKLQRTCNVEVCATLEASLDGAEALVVCTAWPEFRARQELIAPAGVQLVIDGRNLLNWIELHAAGVTYVPVGRAPLLPRAIAATGT